MLQDLHWSRHKLRQQIERVRFHDGGEHAKKL